MKWSQWERRYFFWVACVAAAVLLWLIATYG